MSVSKLGLFVEGPDDQAFYGALIIRILSIEPSSIEVRLKGKCVESIKHNLVSVLREFQTLKCSHILVCADNHNLNPAARARIIGEADAIAGREIPGVPFFVSVAIEGLEAWLISHHTVLSHYYNIKLAQPVAAITNPKEYLHDYISRDPLAHEWVQFAQSINIDPAMEKDKNYRTLLEKLLEWKK